MLEILQTVPFSIPSPSQSTWYLGFIPIRAYGICIMIGILVAVYLGQKRYVARGGDSEFIYSVAIWVIPAGIVGGRLYEIFTSPQRYFPPTGDPWQMIRVWQGGMGIMGAVLLGTLTGYLVIRHAGQRLGPFADSFAPAVLIAQAIGRIGNYFNQELFGRATTLPWGLEIDNYHLPPGYVPGTLFHPTFLYELIWNLAGAVFLIWFDRRFKIASGQLMWLYLVVYGLGRAWVEQIRIDEPAHWIGPLRLASWFGLGLVVIGAIGYVWAGRIAAKTTLTESEQKQFVTEG